MVQSREPFGSDFSKCCSFQYFQKARGLEMGGQYWNLVERQGGTSCSKQPIMTTGSEV